MINIKVRIVDSPCIDNTLIPSLGSGYMDFSLNYCTINCKYVYYICMCIL